MINLLMDYVLKLFKGKDEHKPWYNLYEDGIAPSIDYPNGSMYDLVSATTSKYAYYTAYKYFNKRVNYKTLKKQIDNCARSLKYLGVCPNDKVTVCMPNTPEAIITFYAINAVGAIANMIHPLSSEKEIEFYLNKSNSSFMLCLDMVYPKVEKIINNTSVRKVIIAKVSNSMTLFLKIGYALTQKQTKIMDSKNIIWWNDFYNNSKKYKNEFYEERNKNDDAVILYSGGTTGDPKGVVLSNLNFNALGMQSFKMTDPAKVGDSVLTIMPIFHGFGIGVSVHTCLVSGMYTILIPQFRAREFAKLIKKNKPNFLAGVPTMYEALINSKEKNNKYLKSVTTVICGGDILNETLRNKVDKYLKEHGSLAKIRVGYGLTECTGASCLTPRYYFKEGGIGIPFPDTLYKIIKLNTTENASVNEVGEICISGPTVMIRYLSDQEETKKVLKRHKDGKIWLHTGDVGYMNEEGLVFFESRLKRMIISSGYNIYPQYIEKNIMTHPAVLSCTVVGIPHKYKQEVPKAFIILKENFDLTEELKNDIKKHCEKNISKYALPYEYQYVQELPKTLVGKVAFTKLKQTNKGDE